MRRPAACRNRGLAAPAPLTPDFAAPVSGGQGQPGREADVLPAFQRRGGSESASLRTELPPTKGAVETTKPDPVRRKGSQKPFSTVKSSDSPVFLFT